MYYVCLYMFIYVRTQTHTMVFYCSLSLCLSHKANIYRSIHDHPSKAHLFIAMCAIYTAYLGGRLCLCDALCQTLFSGFFTTDLALWILTVWSLFPHRRTFGTPNLLSPASVNSIPGFLSNHNFSIVKSTQISCSKITKIKWPIWIISYAYTNTVIIWANSLQFWIGISREKSVDCFDSRN